MKEKKNIQKNNNKNQQSNQDRPKQQGFEISGQGYANNKNKDKNQQKDGNNNMMGIQGQGMQNKDIKNNQGQIKNNNNQQKGSIKDREQDLQKLNLQGKNLILPQLGEKSNNQKRKK